MELSMVPTKAIRIILLQMALTFSFLLTSCNESEPPFTCTDTIGCVAVVPGEPLEIGVLQAKRPLIWKLASKSGAG
jgi:hypothetical protein